VLILGETGTGKNSSPAPSTTAAPAKASAGESELRRDFGGLVESELFGHVKRRLHWRYRQSDGTFKLADGGTIFLDEVGELPMDTQVKLLRVFTGAGVRADRQQPDH